MEQESIEYPIGLDYLEQSHLYAQEPPETLYHYTNLGAAKNILESHSIWLTKIHYMNDSEEYKRALNKTKELIDERLSSLSSEERELLQTLNQRVVSVRNTNLCVGCFSAEKDLLSQWREYGGKGGGVSIGFRTSNLTEVTRTKGFKLWRCIYNPQEQELILEDFLDMILQAYNSMISTIKKWELDLETFREKLVGFAMTWLVQISAIIKHPSFSEEKEWRIISQSMSNRDENFGVRSSNEKLIPYYELNLSLERNEQNTFIANIITGPASDDELLSDPITTLLSMNNYENFGVGSSNIPLRE